MSENNGDVINKRISMFRKELLSKYPKLAGSDALNCALDLARLILGTFTRDAQIRIHLLEIQVKKTIKIAGYILTTFTTIFIGLATHFILKLL
tara:strand:- start:9492 stop:9770 length:279 start_codon:yes stop_codon:yes gene_type:complete